MNDVLQLVSTIIIGILTLVVTIAFNKIQKLTLSYQYKPMLLVKKSEAHKPKAFLEDAEKIKDENKFRMLLFDGENNEKSREPRDGIMKKDEENKFIRHANSAYFGFVNNNFGLITNHLPQKAECKRLYLNYSTAVVKFKNRGIDISYIELLSFKIVYNDKSKKIKKLYNSSYSVWQNIGTGAEFDCTLSEVSDDYIDATCRFDDPSNIRAFYKQDPINLLEYPFDRYMLTYTQMVIRIKIQTVLSTNYFYDIIIERKGEGLIARTKQISNFRAIPATIASKRCKRNAYK